MLKIAVFDHERSAQQLEDVLVRLLFDKCEFGYETYTTRDEIAAIDFERDFRFDLVFIELNAEFFSGVEIAKKIRETGNIRTEIVFTSTDDSYALFGYRLRVFDYLIKPIPIKTISETIDRYFCYCTAETEGFFSFKASGAAQRIRLDDIYYFMSNGRKCCIVNKGMDNEFYAKLNEVEAKLDPEQFIRVHQSYIVQLKYIKGLTRDGLMMTNDLFVPVSQKRYPGVKKQFMKYLGIEE
ncbi:MAG: response regulator transcription factor [Clostridia bacterium]|nr:response regulator transcription factor [Clostridia bacterium]